MILRLLLQENRITTAEYKSLSKQPIKLADMGRLRGDKHPAYMDKVRRELADSVPDMQTLDAGVRVFVAMDPLAQRRAESALTSQLSTLEKQRKLKDLQGAMLVTDIRSGELRVIVGDRDVDFEGFNRALDAKRQVGSEIKPAVYLTALEDPASYTLATPLDDKPIQLRSTHGNLWSPKNADKQYRGQVPLYEALVHSLNVPTVGLGMQVGLDNVADMLFRLGVDEPVEAYPAMTLGAVNFSPLMVNQMFQTIANEGLHIPLHALLAVTDNDNRLIWQRDLPAVQRIDAKAAYLMNYALHKVTTEGTARQLGSAFPDVHLAGKTGTTDDYRDSWFSGFDRTSVATVWVGRDDNQSTGLTGASGAMQLYASYLHQQHPKSLLRSMPQGVTITAFDQHGDMLAVNCQANLRLPAIIDEQRQLQNCQPVKPATEKKSWWEKLFGGR
ncbi:penicillin-binding transpeptidase domain-containing protein [Pseudobowmanella zhangzhouensis]